MSVTITDPTAVDRNTDFSRIIQVENDFLVRAQEMSAIYVIAAELPVGAQTGDDILPNDEGITIDTSIDPSNGHVGTIHIHGEYKDAFNDVIKSVPQDESDLTTTPTESTSFSTVPHNHIIFEANQDPAASVTKQYNVTIEFTSGPDETLTMNHVVNTNTTTFMNALTAIYPEDA